jgi:hypothetical protein
VLLPEGLPGRCSGVYHVKNGLNSGLTDLSVSFVDSLCSSLRSRSCVDHGRASPCWCVIRILSGVNTLFDNSVEEEEEEYQDPIY